MHPDREVDADRDLQASLLVFAVPKSAPTSMAVRMRAKKCGRYFSPSPSTVATIGAAVAWFHEARCKAVVAAANGKRD